MESDTPRTDAEAWMPADRDECVVSAYFARELERELAAAKKRIAELEDAIPRPTLSRCLQLEESLRHPKKEGGGA